MSLRPPLELKTTGSPPLCITGGEDDNVVTPQGYLEGRRIKRGLGEGEEMPD